MSNYEDRHPSVFPHGHPINEIMRAVSGMPGPYDPDDPELLEIRWDELRAILEDKLTEAATERMAALIGDIAIECSVRGMQDNETIVDFIKRVAERSKENAALRAALHRIIELDHHNHGRESRATIIAREALNSL